MKRIRRLIALGILTAALISLFPLSVQNGNQVLALNNSLGLTPPMGWNSWNIFGGDINEEKIKQIADAMVSTGMKDAGYEYVNIDDNWMANPARDANGNLIPDPKRFPGGMKALGDYIHSKGLKFGIYGDRGKTTCCNIPQSGSEGYEERDAKTFASWGVDYLKYDNCASDSNLQAGYEKMQNALLKTGRPIFYNICCWYFVGAWMVDCGNSWRTTSDISDSWDSIIKNIDINSRSAAYAGPGHWNDPDMLEVGNGKMTDTEYKAHFSMWCIMAAPLIAGNDLRNMTPATKDILTNREVIAIDQDAAGVQGTKVNTSGDIEVWCKPLGVDGTTKAVVLLNKGGASADITVNWRDIKLADGPNTVRDLWEHKDCGTFNTGYTAKVPSHGAVVLKVQGNSNEPVVSPTPIRPTPTATSQTAKISGYIAPDFTYDAKADSLVKQGFKVEVEGKNLSAITDSTGFFEIKDVPMTTDASVLKFSKSGYLTRKQYASSVVSTQEQPIKLWAGDLNLDDAINMTDIMKIAQAFNTTSTDSKYLVSCDPNRDNAVNMADVMIVAKHFNRTSKDYTEN